MQYFIALYLFNGFVVYFGGRLGTRSIQPNLPEISVQNSMDRFGPTGKVSKKRVQLLRWSSFPGQTGWNFGWMDRALDFHESVNQNNVTLVNYPCYRRIFADVIVYIFPH